MNELLAAEEIARLVQDEAEMEDFYSVGGGLLKGWIVDDDLEAETAP